MVDMVKVVSCTSGDFTLLFSCSTSFLVAAGHGGGGEVGERTSGEIGGGSWRKLSTDWLLGGGAACVCK